MSSKRYLKEFKIEAVKQVTELGHPVADAAGRIGLLVRFSGKEIDFSKAGKDFTQFAGLLERGQRRVGCQRFAHLGNVGQ